MDCCRNTKHENKEESLKGGKNMAETKNNTTMWVVIGVLVIATIFLTIKASSLGAAQATASVAKAAVSTASSGMVGGC